jgi:hypothetical protein
VQAGGAGGQRRRAAQAGGAGGRRGPELAGGVGRQHGARPSRSGHAGQAASGSVSSAAPFRLVRLFQYAAAHDFDKY